MSRKYLLSLLIGFLAFSIGYIYYTKFYVEGFVGTPQNNEAPIINSEGEKTTSDTAVNLVTSLKSLLSGVINQSDKNTFTYIEQNSKIPNYENLMFYLSSFSDFTSYDVKQKAYQAESNKWYNHISNTDPFNIISSTALPVSIRPPNGLPLLNKQLVGPPSDQLNISNLSMDSFTMSFLVKNNDFVFEGLNPIELFKVFVESPNYIKILLEPHATDATKVNLVTIFGSIEDRYVIPIAKLALKAGGNKVLMTVTYNKNEKPAPKLYVFIGEAQFSSSAITTPPVFILGNSRIEINSTQKWDAVLYSFMYFKNTINLETHKKLIDYFELQTSGISSMVEQLKQLSDNQINEINKLIESQSLTISDISSQLEKCKIIESKYAKDKEDKDVQKWMVNMDGYKVVSSDDLQKCTLLKVNNIFSSVDKGEPTTTDQDGLTSDSETVKTEEEEKFMVKKPEYLKGVNVINPILDKVESNSKNLKNKIDNYFT